MSSSEIIPTSYKAFRRDRKTPYGGVMNVIKQEIIAKEIPVSSTAEILVVNFNALVKARALLSLEGYTIPKCLL